MGRCANELRRVKRRFRERKISLIVGYERLRERLGDWGEDRRIIQRSQERKQDDINKNPHHLEEENGEKESMISAKSDSNLEDLELVHDEQSEAAKDRKRRETKRISRWN